LPLRKDALKFLKRLDFGFSVFHGWPAISLTDGSRKLALNSASGMVLLAFMAVAQVLRECLRLLQPFQFFPESGLQTE
jgi:hypothetical protein